MLSLNAYCILLSSSQGPSLKLLALALLLILVDSTSALTPQPTQITPVHSFTPFPDPTLVDVEDGRPV